ncbi:MAG: hypothetical protein J6U18_03130 [Acetobacter sp.]|nr:hypothetical protein [Acetobacter sp.]
MTEFSIMHHKQHNSLFPFRITSTITLLSLLLVGCTQKTYTGFAPACPITHILPEAADYTLYHGQEASFKNMIIRASIVQLRGDCLSNGKKSLKTRIILTFAIERGPAFTQKKIILPWFITVMHNDKIIGKHVFESIVSFPTNVFFLKTKTKMAIVNLPIPPTSIDTGYDFQIGFQLTKEQLAYNHQHMDVGTYRAY